MSIVENDIKIIKKVLNSNITKNKFPKIIKFNVHKSKKGVSIGAKYDNNKYVVTKDESNELKNSIFDLLQLSSIEFNPRFLHFYRIYDRTGDVDIY
jgi:hypothetical protein